MPYKSEAQRRFFNSEKGKEVVGEKNVKEFNKESKGLKLPEKVKKKEEDENEHRMNEFGKERIYMKGMAKDTEKAILKALDTIEKIQIKYNKDSKYDLKQVAEYLWTWEEGRPDFLTDILSDAQDYARSNGAKSKNEARKYVVEYATKEVENAYRDLRREVENILKRGYTNTLNSIKRW